MATRWIFSQGSFCADRSRILYEKNCHLRQNPREGGPGAFGVIAE